MAQHQDLRVLHYDSWRDKPSTDTARDTIKKTSFKACSRRSFPLQTDQEQCHNLPAQHPTAGPNDHDLQRIRAGGPGFRHPQEDLASALSEYVVSATG
jgi:hypothetical protein